MATYHCSIKHGSKGSGTSSAAKADYICREGKYDDKPDLEHKESGNMPEWAQNDPRTFWQAADEHERANGRVYTEIEVALPREISPDQRQELVEKFIQEQIGNNHPYTVAIHSPPAALDGGDQPHAHIIFSERKLDGIERNEEQFFKRANAKDPENGGTAKDRTWNEREKVQQIREAWEQHYNKYSPEQVTCRSLKAQGVDREAERHLGPRMARTAAADKTVEIRNDRKELEAIEREMIQLSREITTQDIGAGEKTGKELAKPITEPEITKKQDISYTPEQTRCADRDELASRSRNTTSSEGEKPANPEPTPTEELKNEKIQDKRSDDMSSARLPELAALDRAFGIEGAQGKPEPRELKENETISGEIVADFRDRSGQENYLVETDNGEIVVIPKEQDSELSKGDEIEATRTDKGYEVELDNGYGR